MEPSGIKKSGWGGARPGSGRKPKGYIQPEPAPAPAPVLVAEDDPAAFLTKVMRGEIQPTREQLDAAKSLLRGAGTASAPGKKEQRTEAAKKVAGAGRFVAATPPPRLTRVA